ncbi:MAG TPA: aryl-sulfate sulfotransferase [Polyangia bacterium]|nr:aryl-sulfate sulfotransferase [Polyangia bacterium]
MRTNLLKFFATTRHAWVLSILFALGSCSSPASTGAGGSTGGSSGNPTGTGGSGTGTGGSPTGTGGSGAGTGGSTGAGGSSSGGAVFTVNYTPSTAVGTVEIVTWSVNVSIDSAVINFGRDAGNFEYQAPVDLKQTMYRTLLLGMKQVTNYSFQISAQGGGKTYTSDIYTFKSGSLPNGLFPTFTKTDMDTSSPLYANGGFTVNCIGLAGSPGVSTGLTGKTAPFIIDKDGDVVWGLDISSTAASNCSRARMSFDGQSMYAGNFANASTTGALYAIPMDGMGAGTTWKLPGRSHDFALLPNGHIMYFATDNMMANTTPGGESIFDLDPSSGSSTRIYDEATDFATLIASNSSPESHTNQVTFSSDLNAIAISMLIPSTIAVVSYPAGKLMYTFGGAQSDYSNMAWTWQHGHDIHRDHIWVFNNNMSGPAHVLGFTYDASAKTSTQTLDYNPNIQNTTFGDVKEQPNGNLFITYSDSGTFHEITKTGTLLRKVSTNTAIGYSEHRSTLYGPPPPFATN